MKRITILTLEEICNLSNGGVIEYVDNNGVKNIIMSENRYRLFVENGEEPINAVVDSSLVREWHSCKYGEDMKLQHDGSWVPGRWYEWLTSCGHIEIARMKDDAFDHFFPPTKTILEPEVVAFRETLYHVVNERLNQNKDVADKGLM